MAYFVGATAAAARNDYYSGLLARGDLFYARSLRPQAGAGFSSPHYEHQLAEDTASPAGYRNGPTATYSPTYTYPAAGEQDGTKWLIPCFTGIADGKSTNSLASAVTSDTEASTVLQLSSDNFGGLYNVGRIVKIDNELMRVTARDSVAFQLTVDRGVYSSTKTTHAIGADVMHSGNSVLINDRIMFRDVNVPFADGNIACYVWDEYCNDSWVDLSDAGDPAYERLTSHKRFQIVASLEANPYEPPTDPIPVEWFVNRFQQHPNRWTRWFTEVQMVSGADSKWSLWCADSVQGVKQVFNEELVALNEDLTQFWLEMDTSSDGLSQKRWLSPHFGEPLVSWVSNFAVLMPSDLSYRSSVIVAPAA